MALEKPANSGADSMVMDLVAEDLQVAGLDALGLKKKVLALGNLQLRAKMTGQNFILEDLQNEGGDLSLTGHGNVLVSNVPARCRLNLQITLRPTPVLASTLHDLLQLAGLRSGPDGDYKFRLTGSLARPVLR